MDIVVAHGVSAMGGIASEVDGSRIVCHLADVMDFVSLDDHIIAADVDATIGSVVDDIVLHGET